MAQSPHLSRGGGRTLEEPIRWALGGLLAFGALNAFGGGLYGMSGAEGVPRQWLEGSPFVDYSVPSLVLFMVVGGAFLVAGIAVLGRMRYARTLASLAGLVVLGWIAAQVTVIGLVSWMQPTTAMMGIWILVFAQLLPER